MRNDFFTGLVCALLTVNFPAICLAQDAPSLDLLIRQRYELNSAIKQDDEARSRAIADLKTLDARILTSQESLKSIDQKIAEARQRIAEEKRRAAEKRLKNEPWNGAGVIPYAVAQNQVFVLLGSEVRKEEGLRWTFFVGGRKSLESPIDTAAQEFWEETRHAYSREFVHQHIDLR